MKKTIFIFVFLLVLILAWLIFFKSSGVEVTIYRSEKIDKVTKIWIWASDQVGMEKKPLKTGKVRFNIKVTEAYPKALIFWQLKNAFNYNGKIYNQDGFSISIDDVGLCKKVVEVNAKGIIVNQTSYYENNYGFCVGEGINKRVR